MGVPAGAQQQLAAEMRGCVGFVERAPLLPQLAELELGEARERLPADRNISNRAAHVCPGPAMRYTRPRSSCAEARVSPSFFFRGMIRDDPGADRRDNGGPLKERGRSLYGSSLNPI
jgi:hypothetical protein